MGGQQRWKKDSCCNFRDLQMSTPARLLYGTYIWLHAAKVRGTHGGMCPSSPLSQPGRTCPTAIFALADSGAKTCSLKTKAKRYQIQACTHLLPEPHVNHTPMLRICCAHPAQSQQQNLWQQR